MGEREREREREIAERETVMTVMGRWVAGMGGW
jgi:hypothetical protein